MKGRSALIQWHFSPKSQLIVWNNWTYYFDWKIFLTIPCRDNTEMAWLSIIVYFCPIRWAEPYLMCSCNWNKDAIISCGVRCDCWFVMMLAFYGSVHFVHYYNRRRGQFATFAIFEQIDCTWKTVSNDVNAPIMNSHLQCAHRPLAGTGGTHATREAIHFTIHCRYIRCAILQTTFVQWRQKVHPTQHETIMGQLSIHFST